jgi:hypothetical protein
MIKKPQIILADQLAEVISERFKGRKSVNCYIGSNAATPTTLIESPAYSIKAGMPRLPFMRMVHLPLQGPIPYLEEGRKHGDFVLSAK